MKLDPKDQGTRLVAGVVGLVVYAAVSLGLGLKAALPPLAGKATPPAGPRLRELQALLPARGEVGYLSDQPWESAETPEKNAMRVDLMRAQFELAPVVFVVGGDDRPVVVGRFYGEDRGDALVAARGLRKKADLGGGLFLLERRAP